MYPRGGPVNSDIVNKGFNNTDLSPYNSKFTVLRFSQQRSTGSQGNSNGAASLRPFELSPEAIQDGSENIAMQSTSSQKSVTDSCSVFNGGMAGLAAAASINKSCLTRSLSGNN